MRKFVIIALGLCLAGTVTTQAQEKKERKRPAPTEEQKKLIEKYDTDKNGRLDKDEYAKVSAADKEKLPKRGGKKKDGAPEEKNRTPASWKRH